MSDEDLFLTPGSVYNPERPTMKHSVTLQFRSLAAKDWFLGQLSDGFGENEVALEWEGAINEASTILVRPNGDLWKHYCRLQRLRRERLRKAHP